MVVRWIAASVWYKEIIPPYIASWAAVEISLSPPACLSATVASMLSHTVTYAPIALTASSKIVAKAVSCSDSATIEDESAALAKAAHERRRDQVRRAQRWVHFRFHIVLLA